MKPVEMQDNLSKTPLLEKVQQLQKSTPEESQKQFVQELHKKIAEGKEKVADTPKSDEIIIKRDDKKKDQQGKSKQENKMDQQQQDAENQNQERRNDKNKKIDYFA